MTYQGVTTSKRSNLEKDPSAPYGALLIGASPFLAVLFFWGGVGMVET